MYVTYLIFSLATGFVALASVAFLAYRWGSFAGLAARDQRSPKWKAYFLALLPPLAFAVTFLFDGHLAELAPEALASLGAPAALGVCLCYNRNRGPLKEQFRTP